MSFLDRSDPKLLQPGDLGGDVRVVGELLERPPPPERKRRPQDLRAPGGRPVPPLRAQLLEAVEIELARLDPQLVAGRPRDERVLGQELAQLRDVAVQRRRRRRGRSSRPEQLHEPAGRNGLVPVHREREQQCPLLRPRRRARRPVDDQLDRAENPELHSANASTNPLDCPSVNSADPRRETIRTPPIASGSAQTTGSAHAAARPGESAATRSRQRPRDGLTVPAAPDDRCRRRFRPVLPRAYARAVLLSVSSEDVRFGNAAQRAPGARGQGEHVPRARPPGAGADPRAPPRRRTLGRRRSRRSSSSTRAAPRSTSRRCGASAS